MSFLDDLGKGSSIASSAVGAIGGLSSLIFGGSQQRKAARYQQKLQMELNEQQQQFARENATIDYNRQRALIQDNASLERAGRQQAGLSTAGDFGSGSASVSPIASPSAGSAPTMPDPNASMLAGVQTMQASANSLLQSRSLELANEHQELENKVLRDSLPEQTEGAKGRGRSDWSKGQKDLGTLPSDIQAGKDNAKITNNNLWQSENEAAYSSANAFSNAISLNQQALQAKQMLDKAKADTTMSQEQLRLFQETYDLAVQSAAQNLENLKKQGRQIDSATALNYAQRSYVLTQKDAQSIQNDISRATKQDVIAAARLTLSEHGPKSINDYAWSVFNNWERSTTAQKVKACIGLPLGFIERALGGASDEAGKAVISKFLKVK